MGLTGFAVFNNYRDLYNAVFSLIGLVTDISPSGFLKFDSLAVGRIHGSITPITTNLEIDPAYSVEGGMVEVIWEGNVNPNITGVSASIIVSIGQTITQQGVYSIFMLFTGGRYKVNITPLPVVYVGDGDALDDPEIPPEGATATAPVITVTDPPISASATPPVITVTDPSSATAPVITVT